MFSVVVLILRIEKERVTHSITSARHFFKVIYIYMYIYCCKHVNLLVRFHIVLRDIFLVAKLRHSHFFVVLL